MVVKFINQKDRKGEAYTVYNLMTVTGTAMTGSCISTVLCTCTNILKTQGRVSPLWTHQMVLTGTIWQEKL